MVITLGGISPPGLFFVGSRDAIFDLRSAADYSGLVDALDTWTAEILRPYLEAHPRNSIQTNKTIHDNVWGIIRLEPNELFILDSPLLQRLRYIRQLGVAHFLFPTTGYSRFEHTLGAIHKVNELVLALRQSPEGAQAPNLSNNEFLSAVRLAALFHDVGHCPFSHVSEKFYQENPHLKIAVAAVSEYYDSDVSPSEILTIFVITSRAVRELIARAGGTFRERLTGDGLLEFVCACVAGSTARAAPEAYYAQLINGTIDCDKLDYLGRDSQMAGTPVMIDTTRLLSKVRVAQVFGTRRFELAIAISGARALEEMIASRVFLYDKLYFHQKVLAAEAVLHNALNELQHAGFDLGDPTTLIQYTDEELLNFGRLEGTNLPDNATLEQRDAFNRARTLLYRLKYRVLPSRIMAFAPRFLDPAPKPIALLHGGSTEKDQYRNQVQVTSFLEALEEIPSVRAELAETIRSYAGEQGVPTTVYVAWPSAHRVTGKVAIHAIDADGDLAAFDFLFSVDRWTEAYASNKVTGYVFADDCDGRIYIAAERAFAGKGVEWNSRAWSLAKVKRSEIDRARERLGPELVRFRRAPTFLQDADTRDRITALSTRLSPALQPFGFPVEQMIRAWIWQFPDPDLQDSALTLAERLLVIDQGVRHRTQSFFIERLLQEEGAPGYWALPIGSRSERLQSGHILGYFYRDQDVQLNKPEILPRIDPDVIAKAPFIVLNDDWICTGTQMSSLLYSWFGEPERSDSISDRDVPFSSALADQLRNKRIKFFFHAGLPQGVARLEQTIHELGLDATVEIAIDATATGHILEPAIIKQPGSFERFKAFLQEVGEGVLARKAALGEWDNERVKEFALGYGGTAALLCSEFSVPTATVTAIWGYNAHSRPLWLPLIPRHRSAVLKLMEPLLIDGAKD